MQSALPTIALIFQSFPNSLIRTLKTSVFSLVTSAAVPSSRLSIFGTTVGASELCELQWSDIEFETATLHIRRERRDGNDAPAIRGRNACAETAKTRG
jgi:hypothetical protein